MQDLTVSLIQSHLQWEDPQANRNYFQGVIEGIKNSDLILLPEMFSTGFSMDSTKNAEPAGGPTEQWLRAMAQQKDCAIAGSIAVRDDEKIYNRMLFATPDEVFHYDKRHLFRMSGENNHYSAGAKRQIVRWRDWRLNLQVCYDLRFPIWSRNQNDYDALIYVANWPAKRAYHWRQLLIARAIENQTCVMGVNRIGSDNNGLSYSGDSLIIASDGQLLLDAEGSEGVFTAVLSAKNQSDYRRKFPSHMDADSFTLGENSE